MTDAREPKKSVSMGQIQATGNAPASAVETKVGRKNGDINGNMGEGLSYNFSLLSPNWDPSIQIEIICYFRFC